METLDGYADALASAEPAPGGGSAAAVVGALGAALIAMVARITAAKPAFAERIAECDEIARDADRVRGALLEARRRDERAYDAVIAAQAKPRSSPEEKAARTEAVQAALLHAAAEPLRAAALTCEALDLSARALALDNRVLASDVGCAAEFAAAALAACAYNVRTNHAYMKDETAVRDQERRLRELEERGARTAGIIRTALR